MKRFYLFLVCSTRPLPSVLVFYSMTSFDIWQLSSSFEVTSEIVIQCSVFSVHVIIGDENIAIHKMFPEIKIKSDEIFSFDYFYNELIKNSEVYNCGFAKVSWFFIECHCLVNNVYIIFDVWIFRITLFSHDVWSITRNFSEDAHSFFLKLVIKAKKYPQNWNSIENRIVCAVWHKSTVCELRLRSIIKQNCHN